jgi:hypothetical protein
LVAPEELSIGFINIVDAIKFLKYDVTSVTFHSFGNIKQYTNQIIQFYPEFGYIYCMAVKTYRPEFKSDELGDKLRCKLQSFWGELTAAQKSGAPDKQTRDFDGLLGIFFPELLSYLSVSNT